MREAGTALIGGEEGELLGAISEGGDGDADEADGFGHGHVVPDGEGTAINIAAAGEGRVEGVAHGTRVEGGEADSDGDGGAGEASGAEAATDHVGKLEEIALYFFAGFGVAFEGHGVAD